MHSISALTAIVTSQDPAAHAQWREVCYGTLYRTAVTKAEASLLVRVRQRFRLQAVVARCAGYRQYAGRRGQPAQYELAGLCWALLVRYLYGWSLRRLEQELRDNAVLQWCTGFVAYDATPDHATLWRFEQWLRDQALDSLFVTVLQQIDEDFPAEHATAFIGDTFGMEAAIADLSLNTLLRQCSQRLLDAWTAADPAGATACRPYLDPVALSGAADEVPERLLPTAAAQDRTLTTAVAAQALLAQVTAHLPYGGGADPAQAARVATVHYWCDILAKILADEFTTQPPPPPKPAQTTAPPSPPVKSAQKGRRTTPAAAPPPTAAPATLLTSTPDHPSSPAAAATPPTAAPAPLLTSTPDQPPGAPAAPFRRCTPAERGSYRILSPVDPDATIRKHGNKVTLGYNIAVLTSYNFVRTILAFTGATPDGATVAPLVAQHRAQQGFTPKKYLFDSAAGAPKHIADVARASDGQTQLIAPQIEYPGRTARFGLAAFTRTAAGLTCPNGVVATRCYRAGSADGWNYRFLHTQCAGCPFTAACREPTAKPTSHRTVFFSDYAFVHEAALAYLTTPAAQVDFAYRANIERINAALVNANGARRARVRTLPKVQYQVTCAALAYNLKRWHTLILAQEKAGLRQKPPCSTRLYLPP